MAEREEMRVSRMLLVRRLCFLSIILMGTKGGGATARLVPVASLVVSVVLAAPRR